MLARAEETTRIVKQVGHGESGAIRIGSVASGFSGVLLELLPAFRTAHPAVLPLVYEMEAVPQLEALTTGTIDIGFLRVTNPHPGVALCPLRAEPLLAALPSVHPLAHREVVPVAELAGDPFVAFRRSAAPEAFDAITSACHAAGFTPDVVYEVSNDHSLIALVATGLGVSLVPASTSNLRMPGVTYRPVGPPASAAVMSAAVPENPTEPARNMLALARAHSRIPGEG